MPTKMPRGLIEKRYYEAEQEYLRNLPPEHFMEPTSQATQREITLESLALVRGQRPDVQVFNELLVQYPRPGKKKPGQVVPDNMVVIHSEPIVADGSYNTPLQPVEPFWMLEYASKSTKRKDYVDNMRKYEDELKVQYYLLFDFALQQLTLYRHTGKHFVTVLADEHGRHAIPELELSMALLDGWVRFWYQGKLLALPAELQEQLAAATLRGDQEARRADQEASRADQEASRADQQASRAERAEREVERLRAELAKTQPRTTGNE